MSKDKIRVVVVGQTPPPFHGQGIMFERVVKAQFKELSIYHVRMAFSGTMDQVGRFQIGKLFHLISVILRVYYARIVHRGQVLYYPPAGPNRIPMYRDIIILLATRWMFANTIFHFQAAGISTLYEDLSPFVKWLYERAYFQSDAALRLSTRTPEDATITKTKREIIIPNCTEDERDRFTRSPSATADLKAGRVRILYVGTVCETKGILVLLGACHRLREREINFHLEVVGSYQPTQFRAEVESAIDEFKLMDHVTLAGQKVGDEKFQRFADADIFCFPTHYESEAFPLVLLEAMSFGLPVVSTNWRGVPSIVEDQSTGYLASPQDDEDVASCLAKLAQDASLRQTMGEAGRAKFEAEFTTGRFLSRLEGVFCSVARGEVDTPIENIETSSDRTMEGV